MSKTVIKIENLSKIYRLGEVGTGTLSHDLNRWVRMNILGQDDPYAKIGHMNDRTQKAEKGELVAALRDINLEVNEGEVLGIIGKNGAGKSTLLKLLSRVTSPTTGSIKVKGRLASLLEVGTGFHPEMTGRENIYMNGTIMGMRKWEIDRKLDEIVEFAGVAKYLDTPTKRYSSGMTVRLGFAIAAHLEPEILVVDEVLAVGDAEFQKKAIGKMQDVSNNDGRTVLFVSHNMESIQRLCNSCLSLKNGTLNKYGKTSEVIKSYLNDNIDIEGIKDGIFQITNKIHRNGAGQIKLKKLIIYDKTESPVNYIEMNSSVSFELDFDSQITATNAVVSFVLSNHTRTPLIAWRTNDSYNSFQIKKGIFSIRLETENINLIPGVYSISIAISSFGIVQDWLQDFIEIDVIPSKLNENIKLATDSIIHIPCKWNIK